MLEQIDSNDHALRINFHLELAKIELYENEYATKADLHIEKALKLDHSIPITKIQSQNKKVDPAEDSSLYQRPYQRYLVALRDKIKLKLKVFSEDKDVIEKVILDLESAQ